MASRFTPRLCTSPMPLKLATARLTFTLTFFCVGLGSPWPVFHPTVAEAAKNTPANHPVLNQAKRSIDAGQAEEAITMLRQFLNTNPKQDLLDDTYLLL